jgi:large subunit ribosomal protein L10
MELTKQKKIEFVEKLAKEIEEANSIGIADISYIPAKFLLKTKKELDGKVKFVYGRKKLLIKALERTKAKELINFLGNQPIILLSNLNALEMNSLIKSNYLKLPAKPGSVAKEDLVVNEGPTQLPAGPALSELKQAGIDAKIVEGKIYIASTKVIVKSGEIIKPNVANALQKLEIFPFEVRILPNAILSEGVIFSGEVLELTKEKVSKQISENFGKAYAISISINYETKYNAKELIVKAFRNAVYIGIEKNLYEKGVIDKVLAKAYAQALALKNAAKIDA